MTAKLPQTSANRVLMEGAIRKIPGLNSGDYNLDQPPFLFDFGSLAFSTSAAVTSPRRLAPFDMTVVAILVAAATALTATGLLTIGVVNDTDSLVDDYPLASLTSGLNDISTATTVITAGRTLNKGDILQASISQITGTAGAGVISVVAICVPR